MTSEIADYKPRGVGLRDWWIVLPVVSIGLFAWASFLYAGLKGRKRSWLVWSGVFLVALAIAFAVDGVVDTEGSSTMLGFVLLAEAIGGVALGLAIRSRFYAAIAGPDELEYDAAARRLSARAMGRKMVADDPTRARQLGIGRPDVDSSFDASLVDLNSAPAKVISTVCGVSDTTAREIVAAREKAGEFSSVEDLDLLVDLPPADVARLKDAGVCVPRD